MNGFYLAKRSLKWAGNLDIVFVTAWSILLFVISVYHFGYLINGTSSYSSLKGSSQASVSEEFSTTFISNNGYAKFFDVTLLDLIIVKFTLWHVVLWLFIASLLSFLFKFFLGAFSTFCFVRSKSLFHTYASVAVMFLPLIGGIIAINAYKSTTSALAPKYISAFSWIRCRIRNFLGKVLLNDY